MARMKARQLAQRTGAAVPAWAASRRGGAAPLSPTTPAPPTVPSGPPEPPPEIPSALSSWRCGGARVVHIRGNGRTTLTRYEPSPEEATFATPRDAERAVLLGSVQWRPVRKAG